MTDPGGLRSSVPVFNLDGHTLLADCLHHVRAALDIGAMTVRCHLVPSPADLVGVRDLLHQYLALQGLARMPFVESDSHRYALVAELRQRVFRDRLRVSVDRAGEDGRATVKQT